MKIQKILFKLVKLFVILIVIALVITPLLYIGGKKYAHSYADKWADKLIDLDERELLSRKFGAAWQDVVYGEAMADLAHSDSADNEIVLIEGLPVDGYPSLSVVEKLNAISSYSNQILIVDRNEREIARIRTDHQRMPYDSFPQTLVQSVCAAEDQNFFENDHGFEYDSFVRAAVRSIMETLKSGRRRNPRGTSTVTQQVGKMFVSQLDSEGQRYVSKSVDRKLREIRIAAALRKKYTPEEIMEVYLNHCLTSSYGLIGAGDVAQGLWGKSITELTDAESVYLSRMVKWGVNLPEKIKRQCHIDMGRIQERMEWTDGYRDSVLTEIDSLTFQKPKMVETKQGHLVDLANIYWQRLLEMEGYSESERRDLDILDPSSLIRKKGNCTIQLTIDLPLQEFLTKEIAQRGYGDSVIVTDIRVGSKADTLKGKRPKVTPKRWVPRVLEKSERFSDPGDEYYTVVDSGKTVYTNVSFDMGDSLFPKNHYRRVERYYIRGKVPVSQYYSYGIIDSKSGKLRAYASRDRIGSRCAGLFGRPVPNGSSTIKPILYALMHDLGIFTDHQRWDDRVEVLDTTLAWWRTFEQKGKGGQVYFQNTGNGTPYRVKNHGYVLEGDQFVYEQLNRSNNILAVEALYRLNGELFDKKGNLNQEYFALGQLLLRLNIYDKMKKQFAGKEVTGVRIIKEIARIVGASVDYTRTLSGDVPISDDLYSVALGTMEMTLLEQMYLFNMLYDNELIERPRDHPSLFLESVTFGGKKRVIADIDTVVRYKPFGALGDKAGMRSAQLGLFRRLGEYRYDIDFENNGDTTGSALNKMIHSGTVSNIAKSGTTDDIRNPYFHDRLTPAKKTNYCLWNGVVRVDMNKFNADSLRDSTEEVSDITVACIGEGSRLMKPSGRDGKSLHKFVTHGLLKTAGIPVKNGFYSQYRKKLGALYSADSLAAWQDSVTLDSLVQDSIKLDSIRLDSIAKDSLVKDSLSKMKTDTAALTEIDSLFTSEKSVDTVAEEDPKDDEKKRKRRKRNRD